MTSIKLTVSGAKAVAKTDGILTAGAVGIPVTIEYSEEWSALNKTVVFKAGGVTKDKTGVENETSVYPDVLIEKQVLLIGVEGRNEDGTVVIPTVWATAGYIEEAATPSGDESVDPGDPIWNKIQNDIGDLSKLNVSDKTSVVNAVNSLKEETDNIIPPGGKTGEVLTKKSDADKDMEWKIFKSGVEISNTKPTDPNTNVWINPSAEIVHLATEEQLNALDSKVDSVSGIANTQSDWLEDDPESPAYIKNRIGGYSTYNTVMQMETVKFIPNENIYISENPIAFELEVGEIYRVKWDGKIYTTTCMSIPIEGVPGYFFAYIGNIALVPDFGVTEDNELPFLMIKSPDSPGPIACNTKEASHDIEVSKKLIVTIGEEYLPPLIGRTNDDHGEIFNNYDDNEAIGYCSHAEGGRGLSYWDGEIKPSEEWIAEFKDNRGKPVTVVVKGTKAIGYFSHAEGCQTLAHGIYSHAEGYRTIADGESAHAEGSYCIATWGAHAEGSGTVACMHSSHAEGYHTESSGWYSHAEGEYSIACANSSHAEGYYTVANRQYAHVQGTYNIIDSSPYPGKYSHIVGNGDSEETRSNAHTLDWQGNAWYQGRVLVGGTDMDAPDAELTPTSVIIKSSTPDSVKRFKIEVLDGGTISTTDVLTGNNVSALLDTPETIQKIADAVISKHLPNAKGVTF